MQTLPNWNEFRWNEGNWNELQKQGSGQNARYPVVPKLVIDYSKLSDPAFVNKSKGMGDSLTGNVNYTLPYESGYPTLAELTAAQQAYSLAVSAAADGDKAKIADRIAKRAVLAEIIKDLAVYLEKVANKSVAILETTGYDLRRDKSPAITGALPPPQNVKLRNGNLSGTMLLDCSKLAGASAYEAQLGTDPNSEASFTIKQTSSACRGLKLPGATPGVLYYGRVRGINRSGPGAWSDVAQLRAM
jgi:hypothetical protein